MGDDNDNGFEKLRESRLGSRLLDAENVLEQIKQGRLPNIEKAVAKGLFTARVITDLEQFENIEEDGNADRPALLKASTTSAFLLLDITGVPQATLFFPQTTGYNEGRFLGEYFRSIVGMMYGALGLVVNPNAEMEEETLERVLRQGLSKPMGPTD